MSSDRIEIEKRNMRIRYPTRILKHDIATLEVMVLEDVDPTTEMGMENKVEVALPNGEMVEVTRQALWRRGLVRPTRPCLIDDCDGRMSLDNYYQFWKCNKNKDHRRPHNK